MIILFKANQSCFFSWTKRAIIKRGVDEISVYSSSLESTPKRKYAGCRKCIKEILNNYETKSQTQLNQVFNEKQADRDFSSARTSIFPASTNIWRKFKINFSHYSQKNIGFVANNFRQLTIYFFLRFVELRKKKQLKYKRTYIFLMEWWSKKIHDFTKFFLSPIQWYSILKWRENCKTFKTTHKMLYRLC